MEKLNSLIQELGIAEIEKQLAVLKGNKNTSSTNVEKFIDEMFTNLTISNELCRDGDISFIKDGKLYFIYSKKEKTIYYKYTIFEILYNNYKFNQYEIVNLICSKTEEFLRYKIDKALVMDKYNTISIDEYNKKRENEINIFIEEYFKKNIYPKNRY